MGLNTAVSGFVVVLLSLSVVQGQDGWSVIYTSTKICAVKGSIVDISCTYTYPDKQYGKVKQSFWFVKNVQTDLKTDPDYRGRVEYLHHQKTSTLRISDLRESDSAVYKFRFITNQPEGRFTGPPGVTLTVTGLQVQVIKSVLNSGQRTQLKCLSSCLPDHHSYVWYRNGNPVLSEISSTFFTPVNSTDSYSCALKGYETFSSPSVYSPRLPSVSVSPSGEIVENSSVTLTCSSDAKPAANYTWYKRNGDKLLSNNSKLFFSSIQTFDSGEYQCAAVNDLGMKWSEYKRIDVKYPPRLPSVSVSPSAEVVEGSSVTLTCSSDANPEANYTWYKENEDSPKASGQIFIITDSRPEHSGNYSCEAQNIRGRHKSTLHLTVLAGNITYTAVTYTAARVTAVILLILTFLCVVLWTRKMEQQKVPEYAAVSFNTNARHQETGEVSLELYSSVNKT